MRGQFFYTGIGAFTAGIGIATVLGFSVPGLVWLCGLGFVCALGAQKARSDATWQLLMMASIGICFLSLGALRVELQTPVTDASFDSQLAQTVTLTGVVVREPDQRERTTHLYVDVTGVRILVYADRYSEVTYGDRVRLTGTLEQPEVFTTELGRSFNYPGYLQARGVGYTMSFAEVTVLEHHQASPVLRVLYSYKHDFMHRLEQILPEPQVGLAEGLLLGVKQALGDHYETVFRHTGLMHIVVLSGYNVMLVVTFFMYVLAYILPFHWRLVVGMVALLGFALLVGLSATVVRASIMAALLLLLRFTGNTYQLIRGLCLAGLCMLLLNPYLLLYDVGFQLSFMATLGLIVCAEWVSSRLTVLPTWFGLREFFTATVVTQIFVLPLLMFHIGEVSLVSVIVNVAVLPMVPVAMLLTFFVGIVSYASTTAASILAYAAYLSLSYILIVADWFATVPLAVVTVPAFSAAGVVLAYIVIALIVWWVASRSSLQRALLPAAATRGEALSEWTIVPEERVIKEVMSPQDTTSHTTPIFFR